VPVIPIEFAPPADNRDIAAYVEIMMQALMFPPVEEYDWPARFGAENIRLARRNGRVVGGLAYVRMGQWFGGASVPMVGISSVGVAPDERSTGVATAMMRRAVEELAREGVPLSGLYPATQPVYRRQGYEQAGVRLGYRMPVRSIDTRDRGLELAPIEPADHAAARSIYNERARHSLGNLDRGEWSWKRIWLPRQGTSRGYLVSGPDGPQGYVVLVQERAASGSRYNLNVLDWVALTPAAHRRILTFFADHRSAARDVMWFGSPADPARYVLTEQEPEVDWRMEWMLRLIDVPAALARRGFAAGLSGELHLEVTDDVLPPNNGRFLLEVADGRSRVEKGGRGDMRIDVRALATLYSGYMSPHQLRTAAALEATEPALATCAALFAGPAPWMPDMF
jgi:predicted acetyltransferase